jgi:hypothetical protein
MYYLVNLCGFESSNKSTPLHAYLPPQSVHCHWLYHMDGLMKVETGAVTAKKKAQSRLSRKSSLLKLIVSSSHGDQFIYLTLFHHWKIATEVILCFCTILEHLCLIGIRQYQTTFNKQTQEKVSLILSLKSPILSYKY